ncbi:MAG: hypothetical protein ACOZAO_00980 [Patescibacteria group bacterium]
MRDVAITSRFPWIDDLLVLLQIKYGRPEPGFRLFYSDAEVAEHTGLVAKVAHARGLVKPAKDGFGWVPTQKGKHMFLRY